ncbi:MAG: hypothetical protein UY81_C0050G0002 [Candidatus Giovannonibacteria bacterium GW2011_GWA2_53_7]|uniref:Uncharacterized protein n=1 Tax=Candidatus Giovannonibacteria bacterium GW2011_GWA2_53_7 TaxID=1618650 RepID=A0A0G2AR17_9BACT|nr:MAG: hypothetical protein UY81_C0050G0002 [Candidatus Giovannonibacteria bacterium GW2011_GWA2_53_7]
MNNTRIILIDQDGVIADYEKHMLDIFHQRHPDLLRLPKSALTLFETEKNYAPEYHRELEAIALEPGFFRNLPEIEGAIPALHDILSRGIDVRICTAPKKCFKHCTAEKMQWIKEHLGQEFAERTIITRDKTLVYGDILIDDKPEVTGAVVPTWEHILYDQEYNSTCTKRRLNWKNYKEVLEL